MKYSSLSLSVSDSLSLSLSVVCSLARTSCEIQFFLSVSVSLSLSLARSFPLPLCVTLPSPVCPCPCLPVVVVGQGPAGLVLASIVLVHQREADVLQPRHVALDGDVAAQVPAQAHALVRAGDGDLHLALALGGLHHGAEGAGVRSVLHAGFQTLQASDGGTGRPGQLHVARRQGLANVEGGEVVSVHVADGDPGVQPEMLVVVVVAGAGSEHLQGLERGGHLQLGDGTRGGAVARVGAAHRQRHLTTQSTLKG